MGSEDRRGELGAGAVQHWVPAGRAQRSRGLGADCKGGHAVLAGEARELPSCKGECQVVLK